MAFTVITNPGRYIVNISKIAFVFTNRLKGYCMLGQNYYKSGQLLKIGPRQVEIGHLKNLDNTNS